MKRLKILFLAVVLFSGVALFAKVNAIVSILPQETFLKKVGGEHVKVTVMVPPGSEPHSYEPKPSQMKELANANVYFSIGVEFENAWLPKFQDQNKKMVIVDSTKGIKRVSMQDHLFHEEGHDHEVHEEDNHEEHGHEDHHHDGLDPHVWLSAGNVAVIAKNMAAELVKLDPAHQKDYEKNLQMFLDEIKKMDGQIHALLDPLPKPRMFMVFHPAWGYFANEYGLTQMAIEIEGKEPKPQELVELLKEAKEEKVHAIFTAPEFSDKAAKLLANELHIPVVSVSPLNPKWEANLIMFAKTIAEGAKR